MLLPVAHQTSRYKNLAGLKPLLAFAKMSQTSSRKNINFLPPLGIEEGKRLIENKENPIEIDSLVESPRKRKKREEMRRATTQQTQPLNVLSNPVILNVDDVVKFSKNIEKKDETIVDLKEKIYRLKKNLSNLETENDSQKNEISSLQSQLQQSYDENALLKAQLKKLQETYSKTLSQVPTNSILTLAAYNQMKRVNNEKQELQQLVDSTSEALANTQYELKVAQEHCGQLYASTRNLQTELDTVKEETTSRITNLEAVNNNLMGDLSTQLGTTETLQNKVDVLQQRYFFYYAVSLKMSLASVIDTNNVDVNSLFEKVLQDNVPFEQWDKWIESQFLSQ